MAWQKRLAFPFLCPSGDTVMVRRLGPDFVLKAGQVARILQKQAEAKTLEQQLAFLETLPDDELEKIMQFGRKLLCDVLVEPVLSLNPREGQLSPDDVPLPDFWALFIAASNGFPEIPVKTKDGETDIESVQAFPEQSGTGSEPVSDGETVQ